MPRILIPLRPILGADEGFFVGYSLNSKAFRVFNSRTRIVEENLHIRFSESTPKVVSSGPDWLFDIDALARTMNYEPIVAGTQSNDFAVKLERRQKLSKITFCYHYGLLIYHIPKKSKSSHKDGSKPSSDDGKKVDEDPRKDSECKDQEKEDNVNITNTVNAASTNEVNVVGGKTSIELPFDPNMPALEDYSIFDFSKDDEDDGAVADMNNLDITIQVSPIPTTRIQKDHPLNQVIGDSKNPKRGIVIRNKARLVAQGYTHEEGIDYDEIFAPVAIIEAIRLFLAYASFKDFVVYQMDVKSVFLYGKIKKRCMYVNHQDLKIQTFLIEYTRFQRGEIDKTKFIKRHKGDILMVQVYVDDIIFGSTKKELCIAFEKLMHEKFQMSSIGELTFFLGLQVYKSQDCKHINGNSKALIKDEDGKEVDVHMYRSMIGSLMYLTSSRPDIMFAVCACARYQVNPKVSHLHAVKRIFSDYAGASLNRKSTTRGCQFFRCKLISWQCKKQTVVANSTTEAKYVAASRKTKKSVRLMMKKLFRMELELIPLLRFWSTVVAKTINGEVQLHALVDGKKIIITESTVRRDLQLEDAEGVDCLPNSTIFEQPALMGMVRNLDNLSGKFLMYPRRVGKGFSGKVTPLFQIMVVQNQSDLGEGSANLTNPHHTPTIIQSSTQPQKAQKLRKPKRKDTQVPQPSDPSENVADEVFHKELGDSLVKAATTASSLDVEHDSGNIPKTQSKAT
ncbi:putative ribonuclease H-like domain-containing protein [Tanacetum coccineum]